MTSHVAFSRVLSLPPVDSIHQVVEAFARTSDHGIWNRDLTKGDQFELVFRRGNWGRAMFGLGKELVPHLPSVAQMDERSQRTTRPATLCVNIRPSPKTIRLTVTHTIFFRELWANETVKGAVHQGWEGYTLEEVASLRSYLAEFYDLPEQPLLEERGPGTPVDGD